MNADRILGGGAVLLGGFLLLYAIPANVKMVEGVIPYPAMFPQAAAWMFIGLGLVQMFFVKTEITIPPFKQLFNFGLAALITLGALLSVDRFGYLPVAIALMAGIVWMIGERRPLWITTVILGLPLGIWLLFEQVLHKPLP